MRQSRNCLPALLCGAAFSVLASAAAAQTAQPGPAAPDQEATSLDEIVVTGTLIRGVAETGSNLMTINAEEITASGAARVADILTDQPQVTSNFNRLPTYASGGIMVNRPDIRNLTGLSAASTTLVLMDGRRMTPVGGFSAADPDVIPPSLLERIEIVPDGGSSTYGADAVAGVLNFITKRRFDGLEISGRYGVADEYTSYDVSITAGRDWGTGSVFGAYSYAYHDPVFNRDRDYVVETQPNLGFCNNGTVYTSNGSTVLSPTPLAPCSVVDDGTLLPEEERHTFFFGFNQELSERARLSLTAFHTRRESVGYADLDAGRAEVTVCSPLIGALCAAAGGTTYPLFASVGGEMAQRVRFSFSDVHSNRAPNTLEVYQFAPNLTVDLGADWRLSAFASYGESETTGRGPTFDAAAVGAAVASGDLNVYDVSSTSPAVLQGLFANNYANYKQDMTDIRVIADGPLMSLPGGELRLAVGAEYLEETFEGAFQVVAPQNEGSARRASGDRSVGSAFIELNVPLVGDANRIPFVEALTLSASARYDDYSDVGSTTNPRIGLTWQPMDWVNIRAAWGESFTAPAMGDLHAPDSRLVTLPASDFAFLDPTLLGGPPGPVPGMTLAQFTTYLRPSVAIVGGNPTLKPQTAETFSIGFDAAPPVVEGLRFGVTYYSVSIEDQFNLVAGAIGQLFTNPALASYFIRNPTLDQVNAFGGGLPVDGQPLSAVFGGAGPAYFIDLRRSNLGLAEQDGLDFTVSYTRDTGFGSVFANVGGTYILGREEAPVAGSPLVSVIEDDISRLAVSSSFGFRTENLTGRVTWNHSAGYSLSTAATGTAGPPQTSVDSFNTVDLSMSYDLGGGGWREGLSLTANIGNVFDEDPPFYNGVQTVGGASGYINGGTLGRFFQVGLRKTF